MNKGFSPSKSVSGQCEVHEHLISHIERQQRRLSERPISLAHKERVCAVLSSCGADCVLDLGCGTGDSSLHLLKRDPAHHVLAIERSEHRLEKLQAKRARLAVEEQERFHVLRGRFEDCIPLLAEAQRRFTKTFLFYPNPWPKRTQFRRRIYAQNYFKALLALSPRIELRTNWSVFAQEFKLVCEWHGLHASTSFVQDALLDPISAFEKKYAQSGHELYRVICKQVGQERSEAAS